MEQQASLDSPPTQKKLMYRSSVPGGGVHFKPNGRSLVAYFMAPKAPARTRVQDAIDEGVDVYGTRPEDLPFWIRDQDGEDDGGEVWGHFFTTAASGGRVGGEDFRISAPGGFWKRYGDEEKKYANEDGDVVAVRSRFAFYDDDEKGGKLTPWRMKEFRLNEGAAAYRGIAFHPTAKDIAVWKVYNHVEISEEEWPPVLYHSSDDDGVEAEEEIAVDNPVDGVGAEGGAQL